MVKIPNYKEYGLFELYQVLNSIKAEAYPHVFEALEKEVLSRESSRVAELEDCYFVLDKQRYPEHAARLVAQIESLGGFSLFGEAEVTEQNKYRTFWPRFWALFIDGFVVGIPILMIFIGLFSADLLESKIASYVDQAAQFAGLAYYIIMHARYGQTLGKMATKVKVIDKSEDKDISLKQALLRDIVPVIAAVAGLVYFLSAGTALKPEELTGTAAVIVNAAAIAALIWGIAEIVTMLFNKKRRAVHDLIAGTVVVRVP